MGDNYDAFGFLIPLYCERPEKNNLLLKIANERDFLERKSAESVWNKILEDFTSGKTDEGQAELEIRKNREAIIKYALPKQHRGNIYLILSGYSPEKIHIQNEVYLNLIEKFEQMPEAGGAKNEIKQVSETLVFDQSKN